MKRRRRNQKRERMIMIGSSLFVLTALTMTGIYVKEKNQVQDDGYVVDLSQLEMDDTENQISERREKMLPEDSETASSSNVENSDKLWEKEESFLWEEEDYDLGEGLDFVMSQEDETKDLAKQEEQLSFSEEEQLLWPIVGNVLINYSMESPVYFATLDQYKYHPAIVIQAKEGQNIMSAAKGKVTKIEKTEELGNVITMDIGSGYEISYGQLTNIQVKEGDVVEKGIYIADVAAPTKYYSVEGDNVYFALKKDGKSVNPMTKMQ